jgi:integrase
MAEGPKSLLTDPTPTEAPADSIAVLFDRFADWVEKHQSADTYRWYQDRLQAFLDFKTEEYRIHDFFVSQLKPFHVQEWIDGMPHKSGTKRNYVRAVKRAMTWAEEQGYVEQSPIAHLKKPTGGKRDNVISAETHRDILAKTRDENFRDLCHFCFLTGARCAKSLAVEARHVELANHRIIFPVEEEKMERIPRIIYLNEEAEAIIRRLLARHPQGKLFRNTKGRPWHPDATNCRFRSLARKIGRKVCLTDYRHSLARRLHGQQVSRPLSGRAPSQQRLYLMTMILPGAMTSWREWAGSRLVRIFCALNVGVWPGLLSTHTEGARTVVGD